MRKVYASVTAKFYSEHEINRNKRKNFVLFSYNVKKVDEHEFKLNRSVTMTEEELKL